ncbi:MAG TPA: rhodanese-like domain-containing protein [Verrucomicrobiae bacterium]|nr:rhodanese-like domain-containing protein [Verrucomicrobiae bacterium]
MKTPLLALLFSAPLLLSAQNSVVNTNIDMPGFLKLAHEAAQHRESRRVSEAEFIRMSREPDTLVLDARSHAMFELLHVKGAVNLSFPDINVNSLARLIPDKGRRILIYCNNNFLNAPRAFATKSPAASLNLSTYVALYTYGYTNVYELGPLLDVNATRIKLESTSRKAASP